MSLPLRVKEHWRNKWHLSEAQIEALEARFIADYRKRASNGEVPDLPARENKINWKQRERVMRMAEMHKTMSQREIAAHYGLTQQRVSQLLRQFRSRGQERTDDPQNL